MSKEPREDSDLEMRSEYDFSGGVRGKYAERYAKGTTVDVLDPEVRPGERPSSDASRRRRRRF